MGRVRGNEVVIRSAVPADAAAIARVHTASWRETYGHFVTDVDTNPWFDGERRLVMWTDSLREGEFDTTVAEHLDTVICFAAVRATTDADDVRAEELTMLYVIAEWHGKGVGQRLLDAALRDRPASLWVAADNAQAHAFYRRNGFTPDGAESSCGPLEHTVRFVR